MDRRSFLKRATGTVVGLGAAAALAGCTTTTGTGGTTYSLDVTKIKALIDFMLSGAEQFITYAPSLKILSSDQAASINAEIGKLETLSTTVAGYIGQTVSVTVANTWLLTVENAINTIASIVNSVKSLLPSDALTVINAVISLLPSLEALVNVAVASKLSIAAPVVESRSLDGFPAYSESKAESIISSNLLK